MNFPMEILKAPSIFIPATTLLLAVLIFWANLWMKFGTPQPKSGNEYNITLGFTWNVIAILYAMSALAWVIILLKQGEDVERIPIGLFVASLFMVGTEMIILFISVLSFVLKFRKSDEPLFTIDDLSNLIRLIGLNISNRAISIALLVFMFVVTVLILCFSIMDGWLGWNILIMEIMLGGLIGVSIAVGYYNKRRDKI